ncbi:MAG: hypothetical protein RTU92_12870 [Candidatus Thorarchaeota archaeon]
MNIPHDWRVAFIQGLADGDGWASVRAFNTAISTVPNYDFYQALFSTFDISSYVTSGNVVVGKHSDICKAHEIPLFRYAAGRKTRLSTISRIISSLKPGRISENDLKIIFALTKIGHTPGEITEILWYEHDIARSPYSIYSILERYKQQLE